MEIDLVNPGSMSSLHPVCSRFYAEEARNAAPSIDDANDLHCLEWGRRVSSTSHGRADGGQRSSAGASLGLSLPVLACAQARTEGTELLDCSA